MSKILQGDIFMTCWLTQTSPIVPCWERLAKIGPVQPENEITWKWPWISCAGALESIQPTCKSRITAERSGQLKARGAESHRQYCSGAEQERVCPDEQQDSLYVKLSICREWIR